MSCRKCWAFMGTCVGMDACVGTDTCVDIDVHGPL